MIPDLSSLLFLFVVDLLCLFLLLSLLKLDKRSDRRLYQSALSACSYCVTWISKWIITMLPWHFFVNVYVFGNKYKSVFSFLRQLTTWHCSQLLLSAGRAAIDRYIPPAGPTAANPPQDAAAVDGWDRQTNRRTDTVPYMPYAMRAMSTFCCSY